MTYSKSLIAAAVAGGLCLGISTVQADQDTAGGSGSASVDLNFQVTVPGVLRFRVGTGSPGSVDTITFAPTATQYADGATVGGTGGDATGGAVNVSVFTNRGQVTITESNDNGAGTGLTSTTTPDTVSYSNISTSSDNGDLPAPVLSDAGGQTATVPVTGGGSFIDRSAVWTYQLDTAGLQAEPATYTGTVTYTASAP